MDYKVGGFHDVSHVELQTGIIVFTKFVLREPPFLTYNVFTAETLCHAVNLTVDSTTLKASSVSAVTT